VTPDHTAKGKASDAIFPLGSLLVGELLECTAVPELREQADKTAAEIMKRVYPRREKTPVELGDGFVEIRL
jgi:uncharacterized NAD(P)/FAD-binding protein YdhS